MTTATGATVTKKRVQTFLTPLEIERLKVIAIRKQQSQSETIRLALLTYMTNEETKATTEA